MKSVMAAFALSILICVDLFRCEVVEILNEVALEFMRLGE